MASQPIYQFYVELKGYESKIWRRFQVMNNVTMARLGYIIMTLFEMQASHLYEFEVNELENSKRRFKSSIGNSSFKTEKEVEKFLRKFNKMATYGIPSPEDNNPYFKRKGYR